MWHLDYEHSEFVRTATEFTFGEGDSLLTYKLSRVAAPQAKAALVNSGEEPPQ